MGGPDPSDRFLTKTNHGLLVRAGRPLNPSGIHISRIFLSRT